jgi:hypothetical protein
MPSSLRLPRACCALVLALSAAASASGQTPPTRKLVVGTVVSLRALANGRYVTAENGGASALIANRTAVGRWEQFAVVDAGNGTIGLRALANNLYVSAESAGASPLIANRTAVGPWESFREVDAGGGNVALRALANNQYVCADRQGASPLIANRTVIGAWESYTVGVVGAPTGQAPFGGTNGTIANGSVIQAENYDLGGEGVAYHDTAAGNTGGLYRTDNVDVEATGDAGGGHNVGWISNGEWLEYTVNTTAGTYQITARVASAGAAVGDIRVLLDGAVLGTIAVNPTGGWQTYVDASIRGISISSGTSRVLRLEMVNGGDFNINYLRFTASGTGDVVGRITVGYQAWFAAIGDGSPINAWWHWSQNWSQPPSIQQNTIHAWPDTREYPQLYNTHYPNLGNGQPARLFSSFDQSTIDLQVSWMKQYGIDTAALQRFNPTGGEGPIRDAITAKVRAAAEAYGVKFYVMYDVSGWTNMQAEIKNDWLTKMSAHTSSPAYARQNGKPVVAIWGFGFNDGNHPWDAATCLDVVNWFKARGVYLIGGVPTHWRTGVSDSRPGFLNVYHAFDMISPWMVGRIGNVGDVDHFYDNVQQQDLADLNAHGIAYQPCVLPGDTGQRAHGDFMWRQFYNMVRLGAHGIYISMYDEYNEGNQIAKTAEDASMSPLGTSSIFFTLDQDGTRCSSDYYLRLTGDGGRMLKGEIELTAVRPTSPQ